MPSSPGRAAVPASHSPWIGADSSCLAISVMPSPSLHFMAVVRMSASCSLPCVRTVPRASYADLRCSRPRAGHHLSGCSRRALGGCRPLAFLAWLQPYCGVAAVCGCGRSPPIDLFRLTQLNNLHGIRNILQKCDPVSGSGSQHMRSRRLPDPTCRHYAYAEVFFQPPLEQAYLALAVVGVDFIVLA